MTPEANLFEFLMSQRPICTNFPVKKELGADYDELRLKYKSEYGFDMLSPKCDNSFNCLTLDEGCVGRPFPIDDDILAALNKINVTVTKGYHKGKEVYLAKPLLECSNCPFKDSCEDPCPTVRSYFERSVTPKRDAMSKDLVDFDTWEQGGYKIPRLTDEDVQHCEIGDWIEERLPWDCLSDENREILDLHLNRGLTQKEIAFNTNRSQQYISKSINSSLDRLTKFGRARKAIKESISVPRSVLEYYVNNLTQQEIADKMGKSQQAVAKSLNNWYVNNVPK